MILPVNGVFYMYGEHYGNTSGMGPSPPILFPKIVVYTSTDLVAWENRGFAINDWPTKPYGTFFTPFAVYDKHTETFVLWFNAYLHGCCEGNFGVATSTDGVNFVLQSANTSATFGGVDSNGLFVDDDGAAYLIYSSIAQGHRLSIETLTSNYSAVAPGQNKGLLHDPHVEGAVLFKRDGRYYYSVGQDCCFCRGGAGVIVYQSASLDGPWVRQPLDLNCDRTDVGDICDAYAVPPDPIRVHAQGIGLSLIPLADGTTAYMWHGERWLSAPNNNPNCANECNCQGGDPSVYIKGHGFSYWITLAFNETTGDVLPWAPFVDSFTLDVQWLRGLKRPTWRPFKRWVVGISDSGKHDPMCELVKGPHVHHLTGGGCPSAAQV